MLLQESNQNNYIKNVYIKNDTIFKLELKNSLFYDLMIFFFEYCPCGNFSIQI